MGAWSTAIFGDDLAEDVRDDWRDAILDGLEPPEATKKLLAEYKDVLEDADDSIVFWLALAAAQSESGRLQDDVRAKALAIIAAGGDVERWREEDDTLGRDRQKALAKLAEKLRGPQRPPTKPRRPAVTKTPFERGDVILIRGEDGKRDALFLVVGEAEASPPGSTDALIVPLLWEGDGVPTTEEAARLPIVVEVDPDVGESYRPPRPPEIMPHKIYSASRGKLHLSHFGEVVLRGVDHQDASRLTEYRGSSAWPFIAGWIEGPWFEQCVAETKRLHGLD